MPTPTPIPTPMIINTVSYEQLSAILILQIVIAVVSIWLVLYILKNTLLRKK